MKRYLQLLSLIITLTASSKLFSLYIPPELMKQYQIGKAIGFAQAASPIEIYFFTNWSSADCLKLEPILEAMMPDLVTKARVFFINPLQPERRNLDVAHLSYLLGANRDLAYYFRLRKALYEIAQKNPSEITGEELERELLAYDIQYAPTKEKAQSENIEIGFYICSLVTQTLKMKDPPSVVIFNLETSAQKTITGANAITKEELLALIANVQ